MPNRNRTTHHPNCHPTYRTSRNHPRNPQSQTDEYLSALQSQIRLLQKRMEAMEPVNMLALEAYEENNNRLQELSNELPLRIENFTTLRLQAFGEAFDAVNLNFQDIFAELSGGDGFLQLENAENPFNGGLNLVAHPKGKPVQAECGFDNIRTQGISGVDCYPRELLRYF